VAGLGILAEVKDRCGVPVLTDVHAATEVPAVAKVADALQIPAFLCRQTDLLLAAGESGCAVNIKKGQFMAPEDMRHAVAKVASTGNRRILVTERGACFGYGNLVADMRSLLIMGTFGYPVVFDATHSVQRPGGAGDRSGGDGHWVPALARAAVAVGCQAVYLETHRDPRQALSDRDNMLPLARLGKVWRRLKAVEAAAGPARRPAPEPRGGTTCD
jgi:2-dehydro-3-deoxyphosphooctonate aldolase (KDO 8-P synthase)